MPDQPDNPPSPDPKPQPEPKPEPRPRPGKPQPEPEPEPEERVTVAEAERRAAEAVEKFKRDAEAKARKAEEERERKAAEEQGKWKELAEKADARAAEAELRERKALAKNELLTYLGSDEKRAPYVKSVEWISHGIQVTADTDPKDVPKLVKEAADKFIADNPREAPKPPPGGGARPGPAQGVRGVSLRAGSAPGAGEKNNDEGRKPLSLLTRTF